MGHDSGGPAEMAAMRDRLQDAVLAAMEDVGVNGLGAPRVPNTTNLWFDHIEGEALVIALDLKGLAVSSGAACSSGAIEPSHVLLAMAIAASAGAGQYPHQPGQADHERRHRFCDQSDSGDGGAPARDFAGLIRSSPPKPQNKSATELVARLPTRRARCIRST